MCNRYIDCHQGDLATTKACALTRNQTCDPLVCRLVLNPLSHTSQGGNFFRIQCIQRLEPLVREASLQAAVPPRPGGAEGTALRWKSWPGSGTGKSSHSCCSSPAPPPCSPFFSLSSVFPSLFCPMMVPVAAAVENIGPAGGFSRTTDDSVDP